MATLPVTAVMLAGGVGSRLYPYTAFIPKPLVPIDKDAIAEVLLRQLAHHGVQRVIVSIGHLGHLIEAVLGSGSRYGLELIYQREEEPLGTVGPLALAKDLLPENFLVLNGDVLSDIDFTAIRTQHAASGHTLTVATFVREVRSEFGVLETDAAGNVVAFKEKPAIQNQVSMGVYAMNRRVLTYFQPGQKFGFDDLVLAMLQRGDPIGTFDWRRGRWLDIGRPADYADAQETFRRDRAIYLPWEKGE